MLFASAGYEVAIYDILPEQIENAKEDIARQIESLEAERLLRGKINGKAQINLITGKIIYLTISLTF